MTCNWKLSSMLIREFMSLWETEMKELTYIYSDDKDWWEEVSVCHTMMPYIRKWCKANKVNFVSMRYADTWLFVTHTPTAIFDNWDDCEILDAKGLLSLISNQYNNA